MTNVLNINDRLKDKKRKQEIETFRSRVETIQRTVECTSCHLKCAMCSIHMAGIDPSHVSRSASELYLCGNCRAEFQDFLEMSRGKRRSDVFWHNKEWFRLWSAWLDYRQALTDFRNSVEFKQLNSKPDE